MRKLKHTLILIYVVTLFGGCGIYSFTGVSIPAEAKTISIGYFPNTSDLVEPTLSQVFTDALRDYFASNTNLDLVERDGDLEITGTIIDYYTSPIAITGNQTAALNRLTIKVEVSFMNYFDDKKNYESIFTQHADYPSDNDLFDVQEALHEEINLALIEDIFNKAVVNW
ncbi:MAG: hypothetical protein CL663_01755 [Bacteroidetes bacterium]|nr:hypothetical protein [Bacteroidota bacterium]